MIPAFVIANSTTGDVESHRGADLRPFEREHSWSVPTAGLVAKPGQRCGDVLISRPFR